MYDHICMYVHIYIYYVYSVICRSWNTNDGETLLAGERPKNGENKSEGKTPRPIMLLLRQTSTPSFFKRDQRRGLVDST